MKNPRKTLLYPAILVTLLMVLYAQFILGHYSQCFSIKDSLNSLGLSFGYAAPQVMSFVESRTEEQLHCYTDFIGYWDNIFPLLYTLMYILWFMYLFKKYLLLLIIPIIHMLADWTENYLEISMVSNYLDSGQIPENLISLGSLVSQLKWTFSILTYALIIIGIIVNINRFLKQRQAK